MDGGVHKSAEQYLRSFAFFPAIWPVGILNQVLAVRVDKRTPVVKEVVIYQVPKVSRTGWANVKPKRCSPNLFLRTQINSDLHDIVHEVHQLA